jgi:hypothetical protein
VQQALEGIVAGQHSLPEGATRAIGALNETLAELMRLEDIHFFCVVDEFVDEKKKNEAAPP